MSDISWLFEVVQPIKNNTSRTLVNIFFFYFKALQYNDTYCGIIKITEGPQNIIFNSGSELIILNNIIESMEFLIYLEIELARWF